MSDDLGRIRPIETGGGIIISASGQRQGKEKKFYKQKDDGCRGSDEACSDGEAIDDGDTHIIDIKA